VPAAELVLRVAADSHDAIRFDVDLDSTHGLAKRT
jgi:hypothetical protein